MLNSVQDHRFFSTCELKIWQVTSKNNRTPLLCHVKFCASLCSHLHVNSYWSYGVTVRKCPTWGKICLTFWFWLWPLTLIFCVDSTFVNGNYSWIFNYDTMRGTLWKKMCDERTDRRTYRPVHRASWSQVKMINSSWFHTEYVHNGRIWEMAGVVYILCQIAQSFSNFAQSVAVLPCSVQNSKIVVQVKWMSGRTRFREIWV